VTDTKLEGKIAKEDQETILKSVDYALKWMNDNKNESKEEYEKKQKEVEGVCLPILSKLQGGMPQQGGGFPQGGFDPNQFGGSGSSGGDSSEKKETKQPKFEDLDVD